MISPGPPYESDHAAGTGPCRPGRVGGPGRGRGRRQTVLSLTVRLRVRAESPRRRPGHRHGDPVNRPRPSSHGTEPAPPAALCAATGTTRRRARRPPPPVAAQAAGARPSAVTAVTVSNLFLVSPGRRLAPALGLGLDITTGTPPLSASLVRVGDFVGY